MFKVNKKGVIHWRHSGVFIINFEHISHFILVFLLLTCNCWLGRAYEYEFGIIIDQMLFIKHSESQNSD